MDHRLHQTQRTGVTITNVVNHESDLEGLNPGIDALLTLLGDGSDGMTLRDHVDLLDLAPYLPKICLLDLIFDDDGGLEDIVGRFQGQEVSAYYGEATGKSVHTLPVRQVSDSAFVTTKRMVELKRPLVVVTTGRTEEGYDLRVDALYIPLSATGKDVVGGLLYVDIQFHSN